MRTNKILGLSLIIIGVIILFAFYIPDGAILILIGFVISICKMPEPLTSKEEWEKDKKKIKIGLAFISIGCIIMYSSIRFYPAYNNRLLRVLLNTIGMLTIFLGLFIYPSKYMRPTTI
jgi:uncharacterized membrane protein HdeD (DUF308 family)